jgi:glycolate oxidase FAD binding subunit
MTISSAAEVAERVRAARAAGATLRIAAGNTWMDAGAPCAADEQLSVAGLSGIVEYEPGDLTLTARAGTPLADLERATAGHGQWLPLEPFGAGGTIGATVATASYGPLAAAFGTPRDQVLGCEVVTGAGDVIRAGGRVVKNVAGFDVTRLMVGAWGTLGVLTEMTVRLRARPEAEATVAVRLGAHDAVAHAARWLRTTEVAPLAAELLSPALAARLGLDAMNASVLLLRLGGNAAYLRAALHGATALGDVATQEASVWRALAQVGGDDISVRLSVAPGGIASLWQAARDDVERSGGTAHANVKRGVVRVLLPAGQGDASVRRLAGILHGLPRCTRIVERAPASAWGPLVLDPVTDRLSHGVRRAFDPDGVLNPGILGTLSTVPA